MTTTIEAVIRELGPMPQIWFRADPADPSLLARIGEALAATPPTTPNTVTAATDGQGHVLWLGPDEWLVVAREGAPSGAACGKRLGHHGPELAAARAAPEPAARSRAALGARVLDDRRLRHAMTVAGPPDGARAGSGTIHPHAPPPPR